MKTILVTGGAGFIGSHLCKKLLQSGNKVICLDNMSTGSYDNIVSMLPNRNFKFYNANIVDALQFDANEIYNLACPASPTQYQQDPIMTLRTCFLGALNVLELAKNLGARVLQASTSEIYGDPLIHPQFEDYNGNVDITGPRACYDEGKRIAETLFLITRENMEWIFVWLGFLIHMVLTCYLTMGELFPISLLKLYRIKILLFMGVVCKHEAFAILMI